MKSEASTVLKFRIQVFWVVILSSKMYVHNLAIKQNLALMMALSSEQMVTVANHKFFYSMGYSMLLVRTSKFHSITTFHSKFVGMLIIYLHTRFHILSSSGSLVMAVKLKVN